MDNRTYDNIITLYFACSEGFKAFETKPRKYGTDDLLYASEIHTLQMIAKQKDCNLTQLVQHPYPRS